MLSTSLPKEYDTRGKKRPLPEPTTALPGTPEKVADILFGRPTDQSVQGLLHAHRLFMGPQHHGHGREEPAHSADQRLEGLGPGIDQGALAGLGGAGRLAVSVGVGRTLGADLA